MKIQSLSVVVPNKKCINHCKFCVSNMHIGKFENCMDENNPNFAYGVQEYIKRLEFARHNGCNTVMLTGQSEPQQNRKFLAYFGMMSKMMHDPFQWVEMQTTGVLLNDNYLEFLRTHVGVNLISLSISSFDDAINYRIQGTPENQIVNLEKLINKIKQYGFSLRLSINLTCHFDRFKDNAAELFNICRDFGADQVTLRVLYNDGSDSPQAKWVRENAACEETVKALNDYVKNNGTPLGRLPFGAIRYSVDGMSTVLYADCMAKDTMKYSDESYKYLILQPNGKLYSQWDDLGSLIF